MEDDMAKIRIPAQKNPSWLPQLGDVSNLGNLNQLFANIPKEQIAAAPARETTGASDPDKKEHASGWFVLISYIFVILGVWLGNLLSTRPEAANIAFKPAVDVLDTIGFLALFFVMAQAIERFMEPISELDLKFAGSARKNKDNETERNVKAATDSNDEAVRQENATAAANTEAESNQIAANTKVLIWGLASFVAMLVSGATRVYFLEVIGFENIPTYLNVLITGLVLGGGTKPLHDLIKLIEKKSENASGDTESG
jgi:hypothetical protein